MLPFRDGVASREGRWELPRTRRCCDGRLLPSRLSRSVPESHRVNPRLAAEGSRTVTAGGDLHPAPKTCSSADYEYRTAGKRHGRCTGYQSVRRSSAYEERGSRLANCLSSVATATASPKWANFRRSVEATPSEIVSNGNLRRFPWRSSISIAPRSASILS